MRKILPLVLFFFILSLSFFAGTTYAAKVVPVPPKGLIPCSTDQAEDPNFNSSRPYQASPCGGSVKALFCSNDLDFIESFDVAGEGDCQKRGVAGEFLCDPEHYVAPHNLFVDLADAMFPIMGNTEQVQNSSSKTDTFDDATKVNEYVSWYLSGIINKAEYGDTKNTNDEIVNYSGPIQKIMPQAILEAQRITTIKSIKDNVTQDAEDEDAAPAAQPENHNQIVVCASPSILGIIGLVVPHECYVGNGSAAIGKAYRLNEWLTGDISFLRTMSNAAHAILGGAINAVQSIINNVPVVGNAVNSATNAVQGAIGQIPVVGGVINNVLIPAVGTIIDNSTSSAWNDRKPPLPWGIDPNTEKQFTAIAYEKAYLEWRGKSCVIIPIINKLVCIDNPLVANTWADLFPYVPLAQTVDKKGAEYIKDVQFQPSDPTQISGQSYGQTKNAPLYFAHTQEVKDLSDFLNKSYTPKDVESIPVPKTTEKNNCSAANVRTNQGDNLFPNLEHGIEVHDVTYTITQALCIETIVIVCNDRGRCHTEDHLTCPAEVVIVIKTGTKTPWANEIFGSTVASSASTFRRIYPKVGPGAPVTCIADIPTVTNVKYDATKSEKPTGGSQTFKVVNLPSDSGATPDSPQLTFPHIGSIYDYFLKGIQTALRPKGFGDPSPESGTNCPSQ